MKPPEQMNDEELCRAICKELLSHYPDIDESPEIILSPDGREAIELEVKRRRWGYKFYYEVPLDPDHRISFHSEIFVLQGEVKQYPAKPRVNSYTNGDQEYNEYRAIATAALKAVRGEK